MDLLTIGDLLGPRLLGTIPHIIGRTEAQMTKAPKPTNTGASVKYVILIIDGGFRLAGGRLGGLTSLQAAHIPNLDRLAREGTVGWPITFPTEWSLRARSHV